MIDLKVSVQCPHCLQEVEVNFNHPRRIISIDSTMRNMGSEIEYSVEAKKATCPKCRRCFKAHGSIWEYPEGAYNTHDIETEKY